MSNTIFYFTGTGNSLIVAKDIAAGLKQCDLIPVTEALLQNTEKVPKESATRIGIVFPVYAWGPPAIIRKFIRRLFLPADCYCFAVATCASSPGSTLPIVARLLKKNGIRLAAGFVVHMPTNYIKMTGAVSDKKQQECFSGEKRKLEGILRIIGEKEQKKPETSRWFIRPLASLIYRVSLPFFKKMDRAFFADDKCNSCGICEKICPANNIRVENGKPVWLHKCEQCYACIQWCPQEAIQVNKKSAGRQRYHHPDIVLKEMLVRNK